MKTSYILLGMTVMSLTTYGIRMLPMAIFRKKITSVWVQSFLYYVPYAVLAAMTFPAVFSATGSTMSAVAGCAAALALAWWNKGLLVVALGAAGAVFLAQMLGL